jgi:hypothetical protein
MLFTITGFANSANNGTFVCVSSTFTTIVLINPSAVAQSGQTATGTTSSANVSLTGASSWASNGLGNIGSNNIASTGYTGSVVVAGFSNSGNNGTFGIVQVAGTAGGNQYVVLSNSGGTSETHAATMIMATAPASDIITWNGAGSLNTGHWYPYNFEIWQSNDGLTPTIYFKLVYAVGGSGNSALIFGVGTNWDGFSQISQANTIGNMFDPSFKGYSEYVLTSTIGGQGFNLYEFDMAGDSGNFAFILWRNNTVTARCFLAIERARDAFGNATGGYFTVVACNNTSAGVTYQQTIFQLTGGPARGGGYSTSCWCVPSVGSGGTAGNQASGNINGQFPAFPIFPTTGNLDNPLFNVLVFFRSDVTEGGLVPVWIYGAMHTYLTSANPVSNVTPMAGTNAGVNSVGIRWE